MANKNEEDEKKIEKAKKVASMAMHLVLARLDNISFNKYINLSVDNSIVECASVALMVMHQSNKLGPSGFPGSIPGWGASTNSFLKIERRYR